MKVNIKKYRIETEWTCDCGKKHDETLAFSYNKNDDLNHYFDRVCDRCDAEITIIINSRPLNGNECWEGNTIDMEIRETEWKYL